MSDDKIYKMIKYNVLQSKQLKKTSPIEISFI